MTTSPMGSRRHVCLWALALGVLAAATAQAAGFEIPGNSAQGIGRGMALTAAVDDGTAVAHNPGRLSQQKGHRAQWSHQLLWSHEAFTRAASAYPQDPVPGANNADALKKSENQASVFPLGVFLSASTDLGMPDWTFAAAGYGPSANGFKQFDTQGGQRYMLTKLDALLAYASLAAAYGKKDRFGIGATLQWAMMPKTDMTLVVDGATGGVNNPYYSGNDAVATIRLKDMTAFSAIVGGWYRLTENLELALSGRILPVSFESEGDVLLENDKAGTGAHFSDSHLLISNSKSKLKMKMAPTAAVGLRYRSPTADGRDDFDIEANVVWEGWSVLNEYNVINSGQINLFKASAMPNVHIQKRWQDTWSARLGGTKWLSPDLAVSAGGYYEQGAAPLDFSHLDFPSFDRYGVGGGLRYSVGAFRLNLSYAHVFQPDRTVDERWGQVYQQRPLAPCPANCDGQGSVAANAGTFETAYDMLSWSVQAQF
ncbi:MAG: outer membrane protein transport protein [Deltaproteobacteria bacterium]|nr:outer membrane protein transport protein [Deltaproteobacteria bacterium]